MGFDLHGMNPVMRHIDEDKYPVYNKYADMDYVEREKCFKEAKKEVEDKFWEEWNLRETENPGTYFRSNVWWWRKLWAFACEHCPDLTKEDYERGSYNDCYEISEEKASSIAKHLQEKIDDGTASHYENEVKLAYEQAEKDEPGNPVDWDMMYPFSVAHLKEFILFCSESGGFDIG